MAMKSVKATDWSACLKGQDRSSHELLWQPRAGRVSPVAKVSAEAVYYTVVGACNSHHGVLSLCVCILTLASCAFWCVGSRQFQQDLCTCQRATSFQINSPNHFGVCSATLLLRCVWTLCAWMFCAFILSQVSGQRSTCVSSVLHCHCKVSGQKSTCVSSVLGQRSTCISHLCLFGAGLSLQPQSKQSKDRS